MRELFLPVKHKQTVAYGCGHHMLANLFDDPSFLEDIRIQLPSYEWMLDESIQKRFDPDVFFRILLNLHPDHPTLNRITDAWYMSIEWKDTPESINHKQEWFTPFFVGIKGVKRDHFLLVIHNFENDMLHVVDSLHEFVMEFDKELFFKTYHVFSLADLYRKSWAGDETGKCIILRKKDFNHLFLK